MKRIRLGFANLEVEFADREKALRKVEEWAERSTYPVQVVYGPEGCGKTAWLRQSAEFLKELGFDVIYVNPVEKELVAELGVSSLKDKLVNLAREAAAQTAWGGVIWSTIDIAREAIRIGRKKMAVIVDDAFQAIGLEKAALYVKGLLGILEHPPAS
ncbi:MAG: ATP-binding protein, partial [Pyrobaculum sp.]